MADTKTPHIFNERPQNQQRSEFLLRPQNGVRQDRNAPLRERVTSAQAYRAEKGTRTRPMNKNSDRSQKHSTNRKTVAAMGWVERPVSDELDRIAKESGQTRSHTIATLLKEAVHQRLHIQHAVMLSPLVRKSIVKGIQGILPVLIAIAYDSHQTRHLAGIALAKSVKPEEMETIRERTAKKARESILHQRPQIAELVDIAKGWFAALEQGEGAEPA